MVKGVNRQIIEVTDMESSFYERALLVVRPEHTNVNNDILEKEARNILNNFDIPSFGRKKNRVLYWTIRLGGAAILGAGLTLVALFI